MSRCINGSFCPFTLLFFLVIYILNAMSNKTLKFKTAANYSNYELSGLIEGLN